MTMIDRLKTPPMAIGLFVAGLLLFAVIGIARNVSGATVASAVSNNVAGAVGRPVRPQEQLATLPVQPTVQPIGAAYTDANDGTRWVWMGQQWLSCRHLDPLGLTYNANANDPALMAWDTLATGDKQEIARVCR